MPEDPQIVRDRARKWYQDNRERGLATRKAYAAAHPEKVSAIKLRWVRANPEKRRRASREWNKRNRVYLRDKTRENYASDPAMRILNVQRVRLRRALKGTLKVASTVQLIGCSSEELRSRLESQFQPGMTWENYGTYWQVDHKKPCASFDLTRADQQKECFHFSNLQPLTSLENIKKGGRYL